MKTVKGGVRVPPWKLRSAGPASQPANIHPGPTGPGTALDTGSATEKTRGQNLCPRGCYILMEETDNKQINK